VRATAQLAAFVRDDELLAAAGAAAARLADRSFDRDDLARELLRTLEMAVADPSLTGLTARPAMATA
jgi:hypothetical protein